MPSEVLGEIFSWTLPSINALRFGGFSIADSPWVLTHVSSRWRAVALSTPSLWSLLVITFATGSPPLSTVTTQIQRAHSLNLRFCGDQDSESGPQIELFRCLAEHSTRWQELSIGLTSDLFPLLTDLRGRLPSLRRLWIQWQGVESQARAESIDCFASAPTLVDAAILSEFRYVPTLLPSHQLTRYDIDGSWEMHRGILMLAKNLVQARIHVSFDDKPWPDSGEIIDLSRLQRLFISHADILQYLSAPVLQEIAISVYEGEDPLCLNYLDPFVLRSGCTLRRLSFRTPTIHAATKILQKYPSITELAILVYGSDDRRVHDLISHLTVSPPSAAVFPQLSEISFGWVDESCIDYALCLHMLQSRWKAEGCALKSATFLTDSETGPDPVMLQRLDELRGEGMEIMVLQGSEAAKVRAGWTYGPSWVH